jgi:uncharacterized protein
MQQSGSADVPLYRGPIPAWLFERMATLSGAITEAILLDAGPDEFLRRLADPLWFQSFGAVLGMDWNSSGVTTAVMAALRKSVNPRSDELGLYVCGGKGKQSLQTPAELVAVGDRTGLDGLALAQHSRLSAKVDNTAVQDGFQLYLHSFVVARNGNWSVVQQGMNGDAGLARRYHWHSVGMQSFVDEPHTGICGESQGQILNLVAHEAIPAQTAMLQIARENPDRMLAEIKRVVLPTHHEVKASDVNLKRLGAILYLAQEHRPAEFQDLLLLPGLGPRTLQSLALVSEVIHGTPSRFTDPARYTFAHGGKGGRPYPVPVAVYDQTIATLRQTVEQARMGQTDKQQALKKLTTLAQRAEADFVPNDSFEQVLQKERDESHRYGGRTVFGPAQPPTEPPNL